VASDDELQRWAAELEVDALRGNEPVLLEADLRGWVHRGDRRYLIRELYVDERIEAGVVASLRKGRLGLLVLTDRRLLFVAERIFGRPRVVSIGRSAIVSLSVQARYRYGTILVETVDATVAFGLVPNEGAWKLVGHWLAGLAAEHHPQPDPVSVAAEYRSSAIERIETSVTVTPEARAFISAAGGTLYLWQTPFNESLAIDKLAMKQPPGVDFRTLSDESIVVRVEVDLPQPREVSVRVSKWPRRRVTVYWDGEQWGRRGVDAGGASWP
jgi:hypothetical protein